MNFSPLTIRRVKFKANKRGYFSALIFTLLFNFISIELIANDKPIFVVFDNNTFSSF